MSPRRFAEGTGVAPSRSVEEVDRLLSRFGADGFFYGREEGQAVVGFRYRGRVFRLTIPLPDPSDRDFTHTPTRGTRRDNTAARRAYEDEVNRRYRALVAAVRGMLVGVEEGIFTLEEVFLAYTMMPDGRALGAAVAPVLDRAYETGQMPAMLLPGLPAGERK